MIVRVTGVRDPGFPITARSDPFGLLSSHRGARHRILERTFIDSRILRTGIYSIPSEIRISLYTLFSLVTPYNMSWNNKLLARTFPDTFRIPSKAFPSFSAFYRVAFAY